MRLTGAAVTAWLRNAVTGETEDPELADLGELVVADAIDCLRGVRKFLLGGK